MRSFGMSLDVNHIIWCTVGAHAEKSVAYERSKL